MAFVLYDKADAVQNDSHGGRLWTNSSNLGGLGQNTTTTVRPGNTKALWAGNFTYATKDLDASDATVIVGGAFYFTVLQDQDLIMFKDKAVGGHSVNGGTYQLGLRIVSTGELSVCRQNSSTVVATTSGLGLQINTWYWIEFKATINNTTGSYEVRVNGSNVLSASGVNTRDGSSTNNYCDRVSAFTEVARSLIYMDDVYILTGTSAPNDFLGNMNAEVHTINGAGDLTNWTPNTGSNFQAVDEIPVNDDTDYVETSTATIRDSYHHTNVTKTGTIKGVIVQSTARMTDAGPRQIEQFLRISSTNYDSGSQPNVTSAYRFYQYLWENNPNTAGAWDNTAIDGLQSGIKLVA